MTDERARALFDAQPHRHPSGRTPDWNLQPEHIRDVFRRKASTTNPNPERQPMDVIPLGSTITATFANGPAYGILVRRDARNPDLPPMLSVQITPMGHRRQVKKLQFSHVDGIELSVVPPARGTHLVLSTDCAVVVLYHMGPDEASVRAWLETEQPLWYRSGDYEIVEV